MKLSELKEILGLELVTKEVNLNKEVTGGYASDMLSWVMAHAREGQAWITIQSHQNIVAVASLLNLACIIVAEGVDIEDSTLLKANNENIPVFSCKKTVYEICGILYSELKGVDGNV
jgi:serine kinase of HPr protein (carbohydrate metabolism regulator)